MVEETKLNHPRYKEEQEAGLHAPRAKKKAAPKWKPNETAKPADDDQISLF
ncbi:hypothetical protein HRW23_15195 [Streptomyces lunaelactis]|uniref:hypothetical protein n=1 Tax=Streptomyces lunaelactis TaxID=1535768 RepID=UPI001584B828|nr:hypothetical protein [Streptomyces lunaelactis]NUK05820.1 hypothetical protein [Streptomyces lunaelactis]NUK20323.1 hypothetical protein [Streptomyces lunaelactis]NUK55098.1 hypothetical protein [Streptomyces lunaelactis]NUK68818.1 hypothetical protein [Streptomyces lunaelactis]NUK75476.1 hypothetical protein [Streptomyces lunaelactis]